MIVEKLTVESIKEGTLFLVDKPLHWTSFDVVNKLRYCLKRITGIKRFKVGHAGTLDPLATGLLLICVGKKTKEIESLQGLPKVYTGTLMLGASTPSYDRETLPDSFYQTNHITKEAVESACKKMTGSLMQIPPIFSAKKINGNKACDLARKGKKPDLKANTVTVSQFKITEEEFPVLNFEISCSKGTYVRSLIHDFGKELNSGAYLNTLRRTEVGNFSVQNAMEINELISRLNHHFPVKMKVKQEPADNTLSSGF